MTHKDEITAAMDSLAADPLVRFIGYGVRHGRAIGTLRNARESQLIETPVAENLMVGIATGLALKGLRPVVFIERFDFILNAADAIVNHLDKMWRMSRGEFWPAVILRVVVGNRDKPLYTGETHTQDFSTAFRGMLDMRVIEITQPGDVLGAYRYAAGGFGGEGYSTMIVERKDLM